MHGTSFHSHSTQLEYHFNYNGDYSGNIEIIWANNSGEVRRVWLPFDVLVAFVGMAVIDKRVADLQDMTGAQALGLEDV